MEKPFSEWTVLPHGTLTRLDDNLLSITGLLRTPSIGDVERRMTIVRLVDGRLVLYGAIALDEAEMSALERFGPPAFLVVPSDVHRLDAKIWKNRHPAIRVIAPAGARAKVAEVVPVDACRVDFGDPSVRFFPVPGTGEEEGALVVQTDGETTLVLNDLIFNVANPPGLGGWLYKALGLTDDSHVSPFVRMRKVKDKNALRVQLERWSRLPKLKRIITSHGGIIADEPANVLGRIAQDLAA